MFSVWVCAIYVIEQHVQASQFIFTPDLVSYKVLLINWKPLLEKTHEKT